MWMMLLHLHNKSDDDDDSKPLGNISTTHIKLISNFSVTSKPCANINTRVLFIHNGEKPRNLMISIYRFIYMSLILENVNATNLEEQCCSKVAEKKLS